MQRPPEWHESFSLLGLTLYGVGEVDSSLESVGYWLPHPSKRRGPTYREGIVYFVRGGCVVGALLWVRGEADRSKQDLSHWCGVSTAPTPGSSRRAQAEGGEHSPGLPPKASSGGVSSVYSRLQGGKGEDSLLFKAVEYQVVASEENLSRLSDAVHASRLGSPAAEFARAERAPCRGKRMQAVMLQEALPGASAVAPATWMDGEERWRRLAESPPELASKAAARLRARAEALSALANPSGHAWEQAVFGGRLHVPAAVPAQAWAIAPARPQRTSDAKGDVFVPMVHRSVRSR